MRHARGTCEFSHDRRLRVLPAGDHELPFAGFAADLGVDVHGEEGAGAVEDGGERAHQRGQHHGEHEASQTCSASNNQLMEEIKQQLF